METRLLETAGGYHFLSRRFDLTPDGRHLHLHSFSGLTHTPVRDGLDYGDLVNLARELTGDQRTAVQIFRRAVFNALAGNDDDHGRNHAFLMGHDGRWRLSPAFDLTQASNPLSSGFRAGRILGKASRLTRRDLLAFAAEYGVPGAAAILREAQDVLARWPEYARDAGLPAAFARQASSQMPGLAP